MIEELNQDSNLVLSDTETPAQPQQPTSDDIFNDLLASQPSQHITPVVKVFIFSSIFNFSYTIICSKFEQIYQHLP